jgi:undecaprenyl-diphosphatase
LTGVLQWDESLFVLLNQHWISPFLDVVMPYLTDFDHWRIPVILVLLAVLAKGNTQTRLGILFAILAVVVADQLVSSGIKPLFARPRPFHEIEGTRKLVGAFDTSFPSAHAANTFAAGTFLALRFRRMRPWILAIPLAVSYSRVYVGVHYPLDVLVGAVVGAGIGFGFYALERVAQMRLQPWITRRKPDAASPEDSGSDA